MQPLATLRPPRTEGGRERILGAARAAFAERGFDGASTAAIARSAGVTQPLVHYHFASKEALWKAVVLDVLGDLDRFAVTASAEAGELDDEIERIRSLMRGFIRYASANPEIGRLLLVEGANQSERLEWLVNEAVGWRLRYLQGILQRGMDVGLIKQLPAGLVALAFLAAASYPFQVPHLLSRVYGMDAEDPTTSLNHTDVILEVFLNGMLVGARAGASDG